MKKNVIAIIVIVLIALWIGISFAMGVAQRKKAAQQIGGEVTASVPEEKKESVSEGTNVSNGDNLKNNSKVETGINVGQKAINFTLVNSEGKEVSLSDYEGKKVLLNFWASWCPPCRMEMPEFEEFAKENPDIVILGVNVDTQNQKEASEKAVAELGVTYPIVYADGQVASAYQVSSIPMNLFLDENGIIQQKIIGSIPKTVLEEEFSKY